MGKMGEMGEVGGAGETSNTGDCLQDRLPCEAAGLCLSAL